MFFSVPIDDMYQQWEGQFEEWFAEIKTQLEGDVVSNILYQLELKVNKSDKASMEDIFLGVNDSKWVTPLGVKKITDGEIGSLKLFSSDPGLDWMLCDGRALNKNEYSDLFSKIGYRYGKKFLSTEEININTSSLSSSTYGGVTNLFTYVDSNNYIIVTSYCLIKQNGKSNNAYFSNYKTVTPMFYYKNNFYGIFATISSSKVTGLSVLRFSTTSTSPTTYGISIPDTLYSEVIDGINRPRYRGYYIESNILHVIIGVNITSSNKFGLYDITFNGSTTTCSRILKDPTNFMSIEGFLLNGVYYDSDSMMSYNLITKTVGTMTGADQSIINELKANGYLIPGTLHAYDFDLVCSKDDSKVMFKFHGDPWIYLYRDNGILKYVPLKYHYILEGITGFSTVNPMITNIESIDGVYVDKNHHNYSIVLNDKLFFNYYPPYDEIVLASYDSVMGGFNQSGTIIYDQSVCPFPVKIGSGTSATYRMYVLKYSGEYFKIPDESSIFNVTPTNSLYIKVI